MWPVPRPAARLTHATALPAVLEMMRAFAAERRLKRIARTVMAATVSGEHPLSPQCDPRPARS